MSAASELRSILRINTVPSAETMAVFAEPGSALRRCSRCGNRPTARSETKLKEEKMGTGGRELSRRTFARTGLAIAAGPAALTGLASCGRGSSAADRLERVIATKYRRAELACLPTPLQVLKNLGREYRFPNLFIKRDDNTGLAMGGNKSRKLEYILGDALDKKSDLVVTWAGVQSNWCRQTAAAARILGMRAVLVLQKSGTAEPPYDGNLLLDYLFGADIRFWEPGQDRASLIERIVEEEKARGRAPYVVSVGGSRPGGSMTVPLGAVGYIMDFIELHRQAAEAGIKIDHVVVATGSAGTQAGLVVAARALGNRTRIVGISVSGDKASVRKNVAEIANATAAALDSDMTFTAEEIIVFDEYVGEGYGLLNQPTADAIALMARQEGILLDPVYTGKAAAGMLDLLRRGYFKPGECVVFMHTGGTPALFPHREGLLTLLKGGVP